MTFLALSKLFASFAGLALVAALVIEAVRYSRMALSPKPTSDVTWAGAVWSMALGAASGWALLLSKMWGA